MTIVEWVEEGKKKGYLQFYSICSIHQNGDPDCSICKTGSWELSEVGKSIAKGHTEKE